MITNEHYYNSHTIPYLNKKNSPIYGYMDPVNEWNEACLSLQYIPKMKQKINQIHFWGNLTKKTITNTFS